MAAAHARNPAASFVSANNDASGLHCGVLLDEVLAAAAQAIERILLRCLPGQRHIRKNVDI
jgi:hypothetical protein